MILDTLIDGARVLTLDPSNPLSDAVGIWRGRIVGVGDEVRGMPARERIDAAGATVLPGFVDSHTHLEMTGLAAESVDIGGCGVEEALRRIAAAAAGDDWVEVIGYDPASLGRELTREDLDRAAGAAPVWVRHRSGHASVVNSVVLEAAGIPSAGHPGLLFESEQKAVHEVRMPYPESVMRRALVRAAEDCRAVGITSCIDAGVGGDHALGDRDGSAFQSASDAGELPVRVRLMVHHGALGPLRASAEDGVERGLSLGLRSGFGSGRLGLGALKVLIDGGMMVRGALLSEPYEGSTERGGLLLPEEQLRAAIRDGHRGGWQLAVHAIGDAALDLALEAIEEALQEHPRVDHRHRIEHGGLIRDDQLERMRRLGVVVSTQPWFLGIAGRRYADALGDERARGLYRGRSLLDAGIRVACGSDRPLPGTPLEWIQAFVTRRAEDGSVIAERERVTAEEALRAATADAAWAARMECEVGVIAPGLAADLVLLGDDPTRVEPEAISSIPVHGTAVDGELRWNR
ncbi:MAG: amidohydrolase [Protaetiibacter sp.]